MEGAKQAINAVSKFCFETLGLKSTFSDLHIDTTHFGDMARYACMGEVITGPMELHPDDIQKIYEMCL